MGISLSGQGVRASFGVEIRTGKKLRYSVCYDKNVSSRWPVLECSHGQICSPVTYISDAKKRSRARFSYEHIAGLLQRKSWSRKLSQLGWQGSWAKALSQPVQHCERTRSKQQFSICQLFSARLASHAPIPGFSRASVALLQRHNCYGWRKESF